MEKIIYNEQWRQIDEYENYYVSNCGRVKNINTERILKQGKNNKGYCYIILCKNGKTKSFLVHRLVAFAFIGDSKLSVDHIDHNPLNNEVTNLRYATRSQQSQNTRSHKNSTSKYKGVKKFRKKWISKITIQKKSIYLGAFEIFCFPLFCDCCEFVANLKFVTSLFVLL